jgi:predicted esterase
VRNGITTPSSVNDSTMSPNVAIDEQSDGMSREEIDWQLGDPAETAKFLNPVLDDEVMAVGAKNMFIGGLSQGCAMGVHLLFSYQPTERGGNGNEGSLPR